MGQREVYSLKFPCGENSARPRWRAHTCLTNCSSFNAPTPPCPGVFLSAHAHAYALMPSPLSSDTSAAGETSIRWIRTEGWWGLSCGPSVAVTRDSHLPRAPAPAAATAPPAAIEFHATVTSPGESDSRAIRAVRSDGRPSRSALAAASVWREGHVAGFFTFLYPIGDEPFSGPDNAPEKDRRGWAWAGTLRGHAGTRCQLSGGSAPQWETPSRNGLSRLINDCFRF